MRRFWFLAVVAAAMFATACDDDTTNYNEKVTVNPVTVTGTVSGMVFSARDGAPLADVNVSIVVGGTHISVVTDENGFYSVSGVPAYGAVEVSYRADGFMPAYTSATFPEVASDVPHDGLSVVLPSVWLIANGGSYTVQVIDPDGRPVSGASVRGYISGSFLIKNEYGDTEAVGSYAMSAQTDSSGIAVLSGIPEFPQMEDTRYDTMELTVSQVDTNGDGYPELYGTSTTAYIKKETFKKLSLSWYSSHASTISVTDTSIYYLQYSPSCQDPFLSVPGEQQFVLFSRPVDEVSVAIYEEDGTVAYTSEDVPVSLVDGNLRAVFTLPDGMQPGQMYWITVYANAQGATNYVKTVPMFTPRDPAEDLQIVAIYPDDPAGPNPNYVVEFNYPVGTGCSSITQISGPSNGIVFVNWDIDTSGQIGDAPSEIGYDVSDVTFYVLREAPRLPEIMSYSGYSRKWYFPTPMSDGSQIPLSTSVFLKLHNVSSSSYILATPWGESPEILQAPIQASPPVN